ncbi:MAG TPA: hypothetical protein VGM94_18720 [Galbitalea sp.]|jgi:hypothetical protein
MRSVVVFRLRPVDAGVKQLGRMLAYRRAKTPTQWAAELPFARDPNAIDRALRAHVETQNALNDFLTARGARTWSPTDDEPEFDLAWVRRSIATVAEVKSITLANEDQQLRLGLGQVLDYQQIMTKAKPEIRAALAIEKAPRSDRWIELCERHGVVLVWPGTFDVLVDRQLATPMA